MPNDSGKLVLKSNFAIKHKWEPFYTGGAITPCENGRSLLCTCGDTVHVIDIASGAIKHKLSQDGDDVTCVISSPDDNFVVSATRALLLKQWSLEEKSECVRTWKAIHTGPMTCMDFDATSTLLATGSSDSTVKIWDMVRQYCTHNLRGSHGVISVVKFHPMDLKIFSASDDYAIRIWDLTTSRCLCLLKSHVSAVTSLAFIVPKSLEKDALTLVSGGRDSVLCIWDMKNTSNSAVVEPKRTIPVFETIEGVLALPDEQIVKLMSENGSDSLEPLVVTAGSNGTLRVWDVTSGKCVHSQKKIEDTNVKSEAVKEGIVALLDLKGTGSCATVTYDHNINIYDVGSEFLLNKHLVGFNDEILDVRFLGASDNHIIVVTNSPLIKVFCLKTSSCQLLYGHQDSVLSLDVFKDASTFVSGSKDNTVRVWRMDPSSSKVTCVAVGKGHTRAAATVACSRTNKNFIVSGSHDQILKIWNFLESNENNGPVNLKAKLSIKAHDKDINSVTVSPNDKLIASGSQDKTAKLWNVSDGEQLGTFRGHKRGIWSVQFSPTDQVLGSSSADGTVKLWALSDFTCVKTLEGHDCSVLKVMFISKGTQLMTSGSDGLLKLWNVKSSECVQTFDGHDDKVWALAGNSSDNIVISGAADSKIIQWEDVTLKERDEERKTQETVILRQQELNNLIHEKKFAKALRIAITLEQPFTALKVVKEIRWQDNGNTILEETVKKLRPYQKDILLKFLLSWNTNSRNCHEAQAVLNHIIRSTSPEDMMSYSNAQTAIEALIPYSERHYKRIAKVLQQTTFVNYIWQLMKLKPVRLEDPTHEMNGDTLAQDGDRKLSSPLENNRKRENDGDTHLEKHEKEDIEETDAAKATQNGRVEEIDVGSPYHSPPKRMRLRSAKKKDLKSTKKPKQMQEQSRVAVMT